MFWALSFVRSLLDSVFGWIDLPVPRKSPSTLDPTLWRRPGLLVPALALPDTLLLQCHPQVSVKWKLAGYNPRDDP